MKILSTFLATSVIVLTVFALVGCETDPSDEIAVTITPNHADLKVGQSQTFVAKGFQNYSWTLSKPEIGVLSSTKGDSTVYTAVISASNEVQVLTVTATDATSVVSNKTITASAEALITNHN